MNNIFIKIQCAILLLFALTGRVTGQSFHTVNFTGNASDFAGEPVSNGGNNVNYFMTFDAGNLYIGAFRVGGNTFGNQDNLAIYIDTDPNATPTAGTGTTSGYPFSGVTGTLPFTANYTAHIQNNGNSGSNTGYNELRPWTGGTSYGGNSTMNDFVSTTALEIKIPFSSLGNPASMYVTMWMGFSGGTYSFAPGGSTTNSTTPAPAFYYGGFGVTSAGCSPFETQNTPITNSLVNGAPAAGATYGYVSETSGSFTVGGNFNIANGGSINVAGGSLNLSAATVNMGQTGLTTGNAATLNFASGTLTAGTSTLNFPSTGFIMGASAATLNNVTINSGTLTLTTAPTINGNFTINNGNVSAPPIYGSASTLIYNATYTTFNEWTGGSSQGNTITAGLGIPNNVTINAAVTMTNSGGRALAGNMTINSGSLTLSSTSSFDLFVGGNWNHAGGTFNPNSRSVWFQNGATQTISANSGSETFNYLIIDKAANNVQLSSGTTVNVTAPGNSVLQLWNTGGLDINGQTFNINMTGNGGQILVSGGARTITSSVDTGYFNLSSNGACGADVLTVTPASSGTLTLTANVKMTIGNLGVDFGPTISTVNGGLQLNSCSYLINNAAAYGIGSTLYYNSGGSYSRAIEFGGVNSPAFGYPYNVVVENNTTLDINTGAASNLACANNLTIGAGSTVTMASDPSGYNLTVGNNFFLNGTFVTSPHIGGDIYVQGNWVRGAGGVYSNANGRAVFFSGSQNSTITAPGGMETFQYLLIQKTSPLFTTTLAQNITVQNILTLNDGILVTGSDTVIVTSNASGAIAGNNANSYINGNLKRFVTASGNYDFPVGSASNYQLANITFNAALAGSTNYLVANFNNAAPAPVAAGLCVVNNSPIGSIIPTGSWTITPDVEPNAGATYTATLKMTGIASGLPSSFTNASGVTVQPFEQIALIKKDAGINGGNWTGTGHNGVPVQPYGTHVNSTQSTTATTATVVRSAIPSFSDFGIGVEQSPPDEWALPVQLLFFTAINNNNNGLLHWATASEAGNAYFDIQRSTDGASWEGIGQVAGSGTSVQTINYAFTDPNISAYNASVLYYRLKQVDVDGHFTYSNIASVGVSSSQPGFHIISTYPNPFSGSAHVSFYSPSGQNIRISVYDVRGALVREATIYAETGVNVYSITDAGKLADGFYTINLSAGTQNFVAKVLKAE